MDNIPVVYAINGLNENNEAAYDAALEAGNEVLSHEISGVSKYTKFAQALNELGKSLSPSYVWFAFTGSKMTGPCKAIYDKLQDDATDAGYSNFYSTWTRVREYGAEITLQEIKASNEAGEKHAWESASAIAQGIVDAKEDRLAKARALKKSKAKSETPAVELPADEPETETVETPKPETVETPKPETVETPKPETVETPKPATVADVSNTGAVDDSKARAAFIRAKESLPVGERVVMDMSELMDDIIAVVQGIDAEALSASTRKALEHILTAQRALAKDVEKAKAHLSRLNQEAAQ